LTIRRLERADDRSGFDCGSPVQDRYIREFAWQNQERHALGVTYVAVEDGTRCVCGYVTLAAAELTADERAATSVPRAFGGRVPAMRIGCIAVDRRFQGRGLGRELLLHALRIALLQAGLVGCVGVVVDARSEAVQFYERLRFEPVGLIEGAASVRPRPVPMLLTLQDFERALG
jgi:ribosomal protein S18 acetylase RimI-like enzyme